MHDRHPAVSQHRRALLKLLAVAVPASGGVMGLVGQVLAAGSKPGRQQGIYRLEGQVTFNGVARQVGEVLGFPLDVVTGPKSRAVFVIGEDAFMVRPNSRLHLDGDAGKTQATRLDLGGLLSVFGKGEATLRTPTAVAGIRGTGLYLEAESDRSYVCLCYGWINLQPTGRADLARQFNTTHHESPYMVFADRIEPRPMMNHSDSELYLLEALAGRLPPFADAAYGYQDY